MIKLSKNLLHVRDNETKEFKPLNVLGTYGDMLDDQLIADSLMGVQNKVITGKINEIEQVIKSKVNSSELSKYATNEDLSKYQLEKPWAMFQLTSGAKGNPYFFSATSRTAINQNLSYTNFTADSANTSFFKAPISGTMIITINAWMGGTENGYSDVGLFVCDVGKNANEVKWCEYSIAGLGVLGTTSVPNYISITSCPININENHYFQVIAKHYSANENEKQICVCDLSTYDSAHGNSVGYGNGNTITFRYI